MIFYTFYRLIIQQLIFLYQHNSWQHSFVKIYISLGSTKARLTFETHSFIDNIIVAQTFFIVMHDVLFQTEFTFVSTRNCQCCRYTIIFEKCQTFQLSKKWCLPLVKQTLLWIIWENTIHHLALDKNGHSFPLVIKAAHNPFPVVRIHDFWIQ